MGVPLIIAGMHRSGTSLTASLLQQLGVNVGGDLVPADGHNPKGYFEDVDFLEFQRGVLQACCDQNDPGWHDWGWTVNETLNPDRFQNYVTPAKQLLNNRSGSEEIWGWKDPRTTLMLDFWQQLIPNARYLLVYRFPWDVADSIHRLHAPVFNQHPEYILPIWHFYNRHLLDFYQRYPDRSVLFCVNNLDRVGELVNLLNTKLNIPIKTTDQAISQLLDRVFSQELFHQIPLNDPKIKNIVQSNPQVMELLNQLLRSSDIANNLLEYYSP